MITVEDLILKLAYDSRMKIHSYDQKIIYSFSEQISQNIGFTEKQSILSLKILKRYKKQLEIYLKGYIDDFFNNPVFKFPLRTINSTKKMSIIDDKSFNKVVKVEFPFNESYINFIKQNKSNLNSVTWNPDTKSWIFPLTETNLQFLSDFSVDKQFIVDKDLQNYFNQIIEVVKNIENHVPMLVMDEETIKFRNIPEKIPDFSTTDIIEAFFTARKYGIFEYDDRLAEKFETADINPHIKNFLKTDPTKNYYVNSEKTNYSELTDIIKYLSPCLFVIAKGNELADLQKTVTFLNNIGIVNEQMSVMFRLPSETDKNFNDFVKNQNLNNMLNDNIKIVFIYDKLPKPLLKSQIKFHSIINLGATNEHYAVKNFIRNHENLILYTNQALQKDWDFAIL
jgi:hypothetical protein